MSELNLVINVANFTNLSTRKVYRLVQAGRSS